MQRNLVYLLPFMNRNIVIRILIILVFFSLIVISPTGHAQDGVGFSAVEVDIWPEYDRPGVLVIYRITLSPDIILPVDLSIIIPSEAGEPSALAVKEADGGLFNIAFTRQVSGEWSIVSFTVTMPEIQLEYYNPKLEKENTHRRFEFYWQGDYDVDELSIQVQQPVGASNMLIKPSLGDGVTSQDGLVYYTSQVGALTAGQTFTLTLEYEKSSDDLSAGNLEIKPSAPITTLVSPQNNLMSVLPWILGTLGIILILGGTLWYWQSGKGKFGINIPRSRKKARRVAPDTVAAHEEGYIYCQNCGKRALPNDRFCRVCGTKLRVE
ncbi:MAG: hypothetical protein JW908_05330 [Anaerolineales bacterium]|nr:hypothetical protein [Anaerolineales bacterium]